MQGVNHRHFYFLIFTLSGFSGLIYESIWSHYLKLFLGHAAFAQTLVLAIFMGGMALGAMLCSRLSHKWKNLLMAYALVEAIIGVAALLFHEVFELFLLFSYETVMPALGTPATVSVYKWLFAALLITPQSVLLGMTFPLMSAGVIRSYPQQQGATVAMLYFSNSIGAAVGVLVSGFVLIAWVGLPGTVRLAGLLNIVLAVLVWYLARGERQTPIEQQFDSEQKAAQPLSSAFKLLLLVSLLTGLASFIYEIAWIRMLSLVLGASTHAFELMLSAFILGLALGGWWIRKRIDQLADSVKFLAMVQLVMGLLALSTLPLYGNSFELMQWLLGILDKSEQGYAWFNISSHVLAMAIMLPTTFCAGMTLPLITFSLLRAGHGEKAIGAVYASNTLGAILGVFFAIHVGMPLLGLKGLLWTGALVDIVLAAVLLWMIRSRLPRVQLLAPVSLGVVALLLVALLVELDRVKMASGVYRGGKLLKADDIEVVYHQDGKAASVDVHREDNGIVSIRTNGKVDASIQMKPGAAMTVDEPTMVLAAALPLVYQPQAKTAAVIGMGSGLSSHTLLSADSLSRVDTIEIEPAMVEGARAFRPRVDKVYSDPRSHIYIDDAKTYFSTHNSRYDIILSEPSNPWVSGTASLFTSEFYRVIKRYLSDDGILLQWIQLYELEVELVASVVKALSLEFADFEMYTSTDRDLLIVAKANGQLPAAGDFVFSQPGLAHELELVNIRSLEDILARRVGSRQALGPLFQQYDIAANSDYAPVLDVNAAKARYMQADAAALTYLSYNRLPVVARLERRRPLFMQTRISPSSVPTKIMLAGFGMAVRDSLDGVQGGQLMPPKQRQVIGSLSKVLRRCQPVDTAQWIDTLLDLADSTMAHLNVVELDRIWRGLSSEPCFASLSDPQKDWYALMLAVAQGKARDMSGLSRWLMQHKLAANSDHYSYLLAAGMLGDVLQGQAGKARELWQQYRDKLDDQQEDLLFALLFAHSEQTQ